MITFKEFVENKIEEGKLSRLIGGSLIALNLAGISPTLMAKDKKPAMEIKIDNISKLYRAIEKAETGSYKDKWIRTRYRPSRGSTAYGPVQITKSLVKDIVKRHPEFYKNNKTYIDKFLKQAEMFSIYGGDDMVKGFERYDYGRHGDLTSVRDKEDYTKMAYDLIATMLKDKNYNLQKFINWWRGNKAKADPRYYREILNYLKHS